MPFPRLHGTLRRLCCLRVIQEIRRSTRRLLLLVLLTSARRRVVGGAHAHSSALLLCRCLLGLTHEKDTEWDLPAASRSLGFLTLHQLQTSPRSYGEVSRLVCACVSSRSLAVNGTRRDTERIMFLVVDSLLAGDHGFFPLVSAKPALVPSLLRVC